MSDSITEGIRVVVEPEYWEARSSPERGVFAFTYSVKIVNQSQAPAQLVSRHWVITDGAGHEEEVRGDGVVGKKPSLGPGESFEYTSWASLKTPYGSMRGSYLFVRPDGTQFRAKIGEFALTMPNALN